MEFRYKNIYPLWKEIVEKSIEMASETPSNKNPFFRQNRRSKHVELVIPARCFSTLERSVFIEVETKSPLVKRSVVSVKPYGSLPSYIIDVDLLAKEDRELADKVIRKYSDLIRRNFRG